MLVDCVLFSAETDMLELRLRTLANVVSHHISVACSFTHQGEPADEIMISEAFREARTRAGKHQVPSSTLWWVRPSLSMERDGRTYERPAGERGGAGSPWFMDIERKHRDGIRDAVLDARGPWRLPEDVLVMVGDVDEIPNPHAIGDQLLLLDRMNRGHEWLVCEMRMQSTALDYLHPQSPWLGTTISRLRDLQPQAMRDARGELFEHGASIPAAGWHLSWLGTDEERKRKRDTFSHAEYRDWSPSMARRESLHINGEPLRKLSASEMQTLDWPKPLTDRSFIPPNSWWSTP